MNINAYIRALNKQFTGGKATEMSYRSALEKLLGDAMPGALVTNEPQHSDFGAPDVAVTRNNIPFGYIETKSIGGNLDSPAHQDQFERYISEIDNLIITNYLEFRLFVNKKRVANARIGGVVNGRIQSRRAGFAEFENLLTAFDVPDGIAITNADALAAYMAAKARILSQEIAKSLAQDEAMPDVPGKSRSALHGQLGAFRKHLIHDIAPADFADIYAQTIAYGMFAARLHDDAPRNFNRKKAAELIPAANPFLRKFFQHIAGFDLDERIRWVVDALADLFRVAAVEELMAEYNKDTRRTDPFLHFYETFLGAYNPKLRKSRGVYYTPEPVVEFIVRAVDEILRDEFKLQDGIAATDKTAGQKMHKVQILDPATGTGTFLAAIVRIIHDKYFKNKQQGQWKNYVRENLIPRLNGFEILMAPYVMAHIKLDMTLRETKCELSDERVRVFLTNALEEDRPDQETVFAEWLTDEANSANEIKRGDLPVMVVIGNPPYAIGSSNRGEWIQNLVDEYKKDLNERKINLDDDYIKFIRYGEELVHKTGEGIFAYISNNSFLDGITHRQMRKHLLETFDKIYVLNLHGDTRRKETAPDGSPDQNVFDIKQGVSINLFVKTADGKNSSADVFYADVYGNRESKYQFLLENDFRKTQYDQLDSVEPYYFFAPKDFSAQAEYEKCFPIKSLFVNTNSGIQTKRDALFIDVNVDILSARMKKLLSGDFGGDFKSQYKVEDINGYNLASALKDKVYDPKNICRIDYRPFDSQWIYCDPTLISRARKKTMRHFRVGENVGLTFGRQGQVIGDIPWCLTLVVKHAADLNLYYRGGNVVCPLYTYSNSPQTELGEKPARVPNLDEKIVTAIATQTGLQFTPEKHSPADAKYFAPIDLLDYIYAVLHSPAYRAKFNEFLKIDFPRVPYPTDAKHFWNLAKLGGRLRALHLMEATPKTITTYPVAGDDTITTRIGKDDFKITDAKKLLGRVRINDKQYFGDIPKSAWNFYIGGYQPAQKYLKDRRGRRLSNDEITHYQKIITVLAETEKVMAEIDTVLDDG